LGAAIQGVAACVTSGVVPPPTPDSGTPPVPDSGKPDAGTDSGPTTASCFGTPPVMTVLNDAGQEVAPDWSCYKPDAGFLFHPPRAWVVVPFADAGDDAAADASEDAAVDATPPDDGSAADAATDSGPDYTLHIVDFVSLQPPTGALVDIVWGSSSLTAPAITGLVVDATGLVHFSAPPPNTPLLTYHIYNGPTVDAGQEPLWWFSVPIVPPPGVTSYESLSQTSLNELLVSILGSETPNAGLAIIVTGAEDCQYRDVQGAQYQVVDSAGNPVQTGTSLGEPRITYLQNNLPTTNCTYTTNQGGRSVWTMINAPVTEGSTSSGAFKLQISGRMTSSQSTPVQFDSYPLETYPGTVSVTRSTRLNTFPPN
jgi:hypothetical protein